jgi:hypothetical protein
VQGKPGIARAARHIESFHLKHRFGLNGRLPVRVELCHIAAHHKPRHVGRFQLSCRVRSNQPPVAQHRHAVGEFFYLRQPVRDVEYADALGADIGDDLQERFGFVRRQRRCRLVEDDDAVRHQQHPGDLHQLALRDRKARHDRLGIDIGAEIADRLCGARVHRTVVQRDALSNLASKIDVLRHRQIRCEKDLLMHQHDAVLFRIDRPRKADDLSVDRKFAVCRLMVAGKDLHQGGFAGAVLADDRVNLSGTHGQRNILEDFDNAERL